MAGRVVQRGLEELGGQGMCVGRCGVAEAEGGSELYVEEGSPPELEGERRRCLEVRCCCCTQATCPACLQRAGQLRFQA